MTCLKSFGKLFKVSLGIKSDEFFIFSVKLKESLKSLAGTKYQKVLNCTMQAHWVSSIVCLFF